MLGVETLAEVEPSRVDDLVDAPLHHGQGFCLAFNAVLLGVQALA